MIRNLLNATLLAKHIKERDNLIWAAKNIGSENEINIIITNIFRLELTKAHLIYYKSFYRELLNKFNTNPTIENPVLVYDWGKISKQDIKTIDEYTVTVKTATDTKIYVEAEKTLNIKPILTEDGLEIVNKDYYDLIDKSQDHILEIAELKSNKGNIIPTLRVRNISETIDIGLMKRENFTAEIEKILENILKHLKVN